MSDNMYERIIHENETFQWRLTVNAFRDEEYLHLRKYILDFDENWVPIKEGVAFPLDLDNVRELFIGILEILSLGESRAAVEEIFGSLLKDVYQE
jgi:hypothetical protein